MTGEEIVALIKEFFDMILNFLIAVGIIKAEESTAPAIDEE
ncbi:MAG TPA: hypothetical protein PKY39_06920 [Clostridiales bacterium]|nr:hypothetical protein [Clostridiales bacterium]